MRVWLPETRVARQLSLNYSNPATELLGESVAQLVRAWQAIWQVVGSSPFLSHCQFLFPSLFLSFSLTLTWVKVDCQVWSICKNLSLCLALRTHPPPLQGKWWQLYMDLTEEGAPEVGDLITTENESPHFHMLVDVKSNLVLI